MLVADTRKGNRPTFTDAAGPEDAEPPYERFRDAPRRASRSPAGSSGEDGGWRSPTTGPVTIVLDA
jgi:D-aminoacyl-tRNA deacylase